MAAPIVGAINVVFWCLFVLLTVLCEEYSALFENDYLTPYPSGQHGPKHSHRVTRYCQGVWYGDVTHESYPSHSNPQLELPLVEYKRYIKTLQITDNLSKDIVGHVSIINNPIRTISVLEPKHSNGCTEEMRETVRETAKQKNCLVAINAGFFNTHTGSCLGNVVSDGRLVLDSQGIQNAHFGIREDGSLFFGYLSESDLVDKTNPFVQLVGGVVWLVRNGQSYVNTSRYIECGDTEETGTVDEFIRVVAARMAVGHDKDGRVVLIQVDGETWKKGANLDEFAAFLIDLGIINAINLDGGGSATYVVNGTTINYPTDKCAGSDMYRCDRPVSTVLCVHEPECNPQNCSNHGDCVLGTCNCHEYWSGTSCDTLQCGTSNCGLYGNCTEDGCICDPGWTGSSCEERCPIGTYGDKCIGECRCKHGICDTTTGQCFCDSGYSGDSCEQLCPYGFYGNSCKYPCTCYDSSCTCHPVTGNCNISYLENYNYDLFQASHCIANDIIEEQHLVEFVPLQKNYYFIGLCISVTIAIISIVCNFLILCYRCQCACSTRPTPLYHRIRADIMDNSEDDSEEIMMNDLSLKMSKTGRA